VVPVQTDLRRRILRAFVGRGLIGQADARNMLGYQHSGFSVDAGVCIQAHDRALERLLRYCARPSFAMDRLRKEGTSLVYYCAKQHSEPSSDKRGAKADELHLTPLAFIAAGTQIRKILDHIGVDSQPPHISPARGPPLWDDCDAHVGDGVAAEPDWAADWDGAAQPASDHEIGQCINW